MYFEIIAELIADRIGCEKEEVHEDSTFAALGIDSLDTVELLMDLEDRTGVKVELSDKVETVGEFVALIEKKAKES